LDACRTAGIKDAYMSKDSAGRIKTDEFKLKEMEVHCLVEFVSGREDAVVKVRLSTPNGAKSKLGGESEIAPGKGNSLLDFYMTTIDPATTSESKTGPWEPGSYHLDIFVDDEYDRTVPFEVCVYEGDACTADTDCCGVGTRKITCNSGVCKGPQ